MKKEANASFFIDKESNKLDLIQLSARKLSAKISIRTFI